MQEARYQEGSGAERPQAREEQNASRLDVLFVLNSLALGGSERKIVRVANQLRQRGVRAGIAALNGPHTLARLLDAQVPWWRLGRKGKISAGAVKRLHDIVTRCRPRALVAVNLYPALYVLAAARMAARPRPRTICLLNTSTFGNQALPWRTWLYRRVLTRFDLTVHGCDAQRALWMRAGDSAWGRSQVIYNGVDIGEFRPDSAPTSGAQLRETLEIPPGRFLFGSVGRLAAMKNHVALITALARLQHAGVDAHLVVVGEGETRRSLLECAEALGVRSRVSLPGALADVRGVLAALDVFVLPSSAVESFSNAALEAMAMARPVILSDVGGAAEMVRDGIDGFVIPLRQLDQLLTPLLATLWADPERRAQLGQAARARVENAFSLPAMVDRYAALAAPPDGSSEPCVTIST